MGMLGSLRVTWDNDGPGEWARPNTRKPGVRRTSGSMRTMPDPLLITVAPTGAETTKDDCPQLPTTLEELVATAKDCEAAGAAMILSLIHI